jgi:hypothetical protein
VVRLSPEGAIIAISNPINDPDGVAVNSQGQVFVGGGNRITTANSLDGGTNMIFATGFINLNNIAIDGNDRIVVAENDGRILEVDASGKILVPPLASLGSTGNPLSFDADDRLFAGGCAVPGPVGSLVIIIDGVVIPVTTQTINPQRIAFGPGGAFGNEIFASEPLLNRVLKVDESTGTITTFTTGIKNPVGLAFDGTNVLYVAEPGLGRIIKIFPTNSPPVAVCKETFEIPADSNCQATITTLDVDGGSYDPDEGDEITLSLDNSGPFGIGTHYVELTVTDQKGESDSCFATVTVVDTLAPVPDAADNCDAAPTNKTGKITSVVSNEPINGLGDGETSPDWEITGDLTLNLRAERSGNGNGRIYTVTVECTDDVGNTTTGTVTVVVPKNKK